MLQQRQGGFQDQATHRSPGSRTIKWREVFVKAENLFINGEYEQALVWYHRGRRLKPKAREFITGITKCEQAIENRCPVALHNLAPRSSHTGRRQVGVKSARSSQVTSQEVQTKKEELDRDIHHVVSLNKDKRYLQGLLKELQEDEAVDGEPSWPEPSGPQWRTVKQLVESSLHYLDTRTTFWKQQMPLHAMERLHTRPPTQGRMDTMLQMQHQASEESTAAFMVLLKEMMKCNQEFIDQQYKKCIPRCENCVKMLKKLRSNDLENKYEMLSNLYSVLGNAYFELGEYEEALKSYTKDLDIARSKDMKEARSRALENMGRVHARVGEFDTAIRVWKEKAELCDADRECAWLHHEIGYCYLSKKDYFMAQQYADMAGRAALAADDIRWRLNATILSAQVQAKMKNYESALESFQVALIFATDIGDEAELKAIADAINSLEKAIESRKNNSQANQKSDVFLTEFFEEEKEQKSTTPAPSTNTLRNRDLERVHHDNVYESPLGGHSDQVPDSLRRNDTLTPLQFQSQGLDTSHYAKGQNNLALKLHLPDKTVAHDKEVKLVGPSAVENGNGPVQSVKVSRNRKLYNTPQLQNSTQSTALDFTTEYGDDPNMRQSNGKFIELNNSESNQQGKINSANTTGFKQDHKSRNRFSSKFSELRVRHRQERVAEELQPDKDEKVPLTSESIMNMESTYRGRSSKTYNWKPKEKMNVANFPWKSTRQHKTTEGDQSNADEYRSSAKHGRINQKLQNNMDKEGYHAEKENMKKVNSEDKDVTARSGSKRVLLKRTSKTPRSSQSDGNLLIKKSPVRQGYPRSQTVKASDSDARFGQDNGTASTSQSVSLQRIDVSHHNNNSSSGFVSYNVDKSSGADLNRDTSKKTLNKQKSGSQTLPMLQYKPVETQYEIPSVSQTSRVNKDRHSGYSDRSQDLRLPGLPGREQHISGHSGKDVINMEAYQKPLPKQEGVHTPKNILPPKKTKTAGQKNDKSDMDLLKMLLDM